LFLPDGSSYITFNDLTDLLGHASETLESLTTMWSESMQQCKCKEGRIGYDDFLILMKGQKRESHRPSLVWDPKSSLVLAEIQDSLEEISRGSFRGSTHDPIVEEPEPENKHQEKEKTQLTKGKGYLRKRSKSFDDIPIPKSYLEEKNKGRRCSLPAKIRGSLVKNGNLKVIVNESKAPLLATREQYKKHRDLRIALLEASKKFDIKCQSRRAALEGRDLISPVHGAGLIMKRGALPPQGMSVHLPATLAGRFMY
jgi:hypothetical protein